MGRPQLLLATAGRESVPMGAELPVCSKGEERRGIKRVSDVSDIFLRGRLYSVPGKRMRFICIF